MTTTTIADAVSSFQLQVAAGKVDIQERFDQTLTAAFCTLVDSGELASVAVAGYRKDACVVSYTDLANQLNCNYDLIAPAAAVYCAKHTTVHMTFYCYEGDDDDPAQVRVSWAKE